MDRVTAPCAAGAANVAHITRKADNSANDVRAEHELDFIRASVSGSIKEWMKRQTSERLWRMSPAIRSAPMYSCMASLVSITSLRWTAGRLVSASSILSCFCRLIRFRAASQKYFPAPSRSSALPSDSGAAAVAPSAAIKACALRTDPSPNAMICWASGASCGFCSIRAAASRTFCTAGRSSPMSTAMIAITTSNSAPVNPRERTTVLHVMTHLPLRR